MLALAGPVDAQDKRDVGLLGRCRDDHRLRASRNVLRGALAAGEQAR